MSSKPPNTRKYQYLDQLHAADIAYKYTPFDQGAMVEVLDQNWQGSCNVLSHEWMLRKASQEDMTQPTTYEITEPFLPHPVVVGDNDLYGQDIEAIQEKFEQATEEQLLKDKFSLPTAPTGIDKLVNHINSAEYHYGIISATIVPENGSAFAHVVAFVKRRNNISFFDPNHGEITFNNVEDFRFWLQGETSQGQLKFIGDNANDYKQLNELFPQPQPDIETLHSENDLMNYMANYRNQVDKSRAETKVTIVTGFSVSSYASSRYVNPDPDLTKQVDVKPLPSSQPHSEVESQTLAHQHDLKHTLHDLKISNKAAEPLKTKDTSDDSSNNHSP